MPIEEYFKTMNIKQIKSGLLEKPVETLFYYLPAIEPEFKQFGLKSDNVNVKILVTSQCGSIVTLKKHTSASLQLLRGEKSKFRKSRFCGVLVLMLIPKFIIYLNPPFARIIP